jgi:hypothetical protein
MSWKHVNVWRTATVPISSRKIAAYAAWTDGLETARNLYGAPWSPYFSDKIFVSGHGGEIGRAFYWKDAIGSPNGHLAVLARFAGSLVPARWSSTTEERVHAEVDRYHWLKPTARLDAFYARSRTRNWTGRGIRRRNFSGGVMGFCDPETVRILLGVPDELKRDAAFFDEVIACDTRRLRDVAKSAAALQWAALTSGGKSVGATPPSSEMRDATKVGIRLFGHGSLLRDAFGPKWCGRLLRNAARRQPDHFRRALWNAASVEGLHRLANGAEHSRHA